MFPWTSNRLLRKALSLYAGDHVVDRVLRLGDRALELDGTPRDLTLMFVDVAGFTEPYEPMAPSNLRGLMNQWFEALTSSIASHDGTLDTYVGDSMSAWWSADGKEMNTDRAVDCARNIVDAVAQLNRDFKFRNWPQLKVCVGIHTGPTRLGNYGSTRRLRFSVLGDTVNFASRLCGMSTHYGRPILISEATKDRLKHHADVEHVDTVKVKGRDGAVQIYAVGPSNHLMQPTGKQQPAAD
jgi:adenylate cyclase